MRFFLIIPMVLATSCSGGAEDTSSQNETNRQSPADLVEPQSLPAEAAEAASVEAVPLNPPGDPALARLGPARRREYDRGYRDCARGQYKFDAEQQGEYYRIGCMTAENAKAGVER